jgi:hypothetical protein
MTITEATGKDLTDIMSVLPDNVEIRFYAHELNKKKTPVLLWSNKPKE